jgi:uncharacterized protein
VLELLILFLALGVVAGLLAGTLGLGGGVVIVPALLMIFPLMGFPGRHHRAAGGGHLTGHHCRNLGQRHSWPPPPGAVRWPVALPMSAGILAGAFAGAFVASALPSATLARLFGVFAMIIAAQMAISSQRSDDSGAERLPGRCRDWRWPVR